MSSITSRTRRHFAFAALSGVAMTLAFAGIGHAQSDDTVRTVKIATAAESKPLAWGAIGVEPEGFEPDLLRAIDEKLPQYKFEMEGVADIAQETGLATGKYDMAVGGYYKVPARMKQFLIPETAECASLMRIYTRADSDIEGMKDLAGKRIVPVTAGGGVYKFVTQWQEENPDVDVEVTASSAGIPYPDRLKEVQNGKYDALILPSNLGEQTVIDEQGLKIKASEPVAITNTYFLIHRSDENEQLLQDVDKALMELRQDGTVSKLSMQWFGEDCSTYVK